MPESSFELPCRQCGTMRLINIPAHASAIARLSGLLCKKCAVDSRRQCPTGRKCLTCGKDLVRREGEHLSNFNRRNRCSRRCISGAPLSDRFWEKVDKNGPVPSHRPELGPCWIRVGAYGGKLWVGEHQISGHVVSFFLEHGRWPHPWCLHKCDSGPAGCVRPDHLFEGTAEENSVDMVEKNRHSAVTRPERIPRGERHGMSKLTAELVVNEVRPALARGEPKTSIARRLGVSEGAIFSVARGLTWKHV